jgi:hypothetical protein
MTHRILLSTLVIDTPTEVRDRTVEFWAAALGADPLATPMPQYHILRGRPRPPDGRAGVVGAPSVHIDIHTMTLEAEVERLVGAGQRSSRGPTTRQLGRDARPQRHGVLRRLGPQQRAPG